MSTLTHELTLPQPIELSDAETLPPSSEQIKEVELKHQSALLDVYNTEPLVEGEYSSVVAQVEVGTRVINIIRSNESMNGQPIIELQANGETNGSVTDDAEKISWVTLLPGKEPIEFGKVGDPGDRLGLNIAAVSSRQFSGELTKDGFLWITDLDSANGTRVKGHEVALYGETHKGSHYDEVRAKGIGGDIALGHAGETDVTKPEVNIDGITFKLEGKLTTEDREDALELSSVDTEGVSRSFMVYRSNSEGALRVSQGRINTGQYRRYLKGGGSFAEDSQYTQDTQLHPDFAEFVEAALARPTELPDAGHTDVKIVQGKVVEAHKDFIDQMKVRDFPNAYLKTALKRIPAGHINYDTIKNGFKEELKQPGATVETVLDKYVEDINYVLKNSDLVPDFSTPEKTTMENHPILGTLTRDYFTKDVEGKPHEWQVVRDIDGRVWIDRIRLSDSKATAYGTDKDLIYSGILTSKPIDYFSQADAIRGGTQLQGNYIGITRFLEKLQPIIKYREERGIVRT
jgi:hypothetical protein